MKEDWWAQVGRETYILSELLPGLTAYLLFHGLSNSALKPYNI